MERDEDAEDFSFTMRTKPPSEFAGQQLFTEAEDWQNNAQLGWSHFPLHVYALGYKEAADSLAQVLLDRRASLDTAIYPLVFLYRQGLELQLKLILPLARRLADAPPKDDHRHELLPMWSELRMHLELVNPQENDQELPAIEEFIRQLQEVDPQSYSFRYPTGKKGDISLPDLRHVNVRHLSEIMNSVFMLMDGIHASLGELEQHDEYGEW